MDFEKWLLFLTLATLDYNRGCAIVEEPLPYVLQKPMKMKMKGVCSLFAHQDIKTPTPHCNYFKFVDEDDEAVTSRIHSNCTACDGITVQDFDDVRTRLHYMETNYGRRLERMERNIKAMVYFIVFATIFYFIM
ncbi:unnamed protein product [Camellia sinensis]